MIIKIANKKIGKDQPVFIVAELGINHNGKIETAKKMIKQAKKAGADAVKIQSFQAEKLVDKKLTYTYTSGGKKVIESQYKMFKRYELNRQQQKQLFDFAKQQGIIIFSTPQDRETVDFLCSKEINSPAIKIGSDDISNLNIPLLSYCASRKKPIIISTGMSTLDKIKQAVKIIEKAGNKKIIILKCTSLYPASPAVFNLNDIKTLQQEFADKIIGYSDHTQGIIAVIASVVLGAKVIEKHFTLDKKMPGPDHWFSADPKELKALATEVRRTEEMLKGKAFNLSKQELKMKALCRGSVQVRKDIRPGEIMQPGHLKVIRTKKGLPADKYLPLIIGKKAKKPFKKDHIFTKNDL